MEVYARSTELGIRSGQSRERSHGVKVVLACEVGGYEEFWQLETHPTLKEAITACRRQVDEFLEKEHKAGLRGEELYARYVESGPDIYVDADLGEPVFRGWEYAKKRAATMLYRADHPTECLQLL